MVSLAARRISTARWNSWVAFWASIWAFSSETAAVIITSNVKTRRPSWKYCFSAFRWWTLMLQTSRFHDGLRFNPILPLRVTSVKKLMESLHHSIMTAFNLLNCHICYQFCHTSWSKICSHMSWAQQWSCPTSRAWVCMCNVWPLMEPTWSNRQSEALSIRKSDTLSLFLSAHSHSQ